MLMPSHAKHVKHYKDTQPLFTRYGIESQLDAMFSPVVQLRSGGYIVINQAEALVAIDVNSGRATREHHIEDTALKTNCEAAEEIARQLRLRDLAGLIVIDFIDMDEGRNNRTVERRMKEALSTTAPASRSAASRISVCSKCRASASAPRSLKARPRNARSAAAAGHVRSVSSVALQLLRAIEEMLIKGATHNLIVRTRAEVALYVLNHKRAHLRALEERFRVTLTVSADPAVTGQQSYVVDRGEQVHTVEAAKSIAAAHPIPLPTVDEEDEFVADEAEEDIVEAQEHEQVAAAPAQADEDAPRRDGEREGGPRRRRRRGRGGRGRGSEPREGASAFTHDTVPEHAVTHEDHDAGAPEEEGFSPPQPRPEGGPAGESDRDGVRRRRRRGRRGGRRNRPHNGEAPFRSAENGAEPELQHAVEDLDRPPSYDTAPAASYAPPIEQRAGAGSNGASGRCCKRAGAAAPALDDPRACAFRKRASASRLLARHAIDSGDIQHRA